MPKTISTQERRAIISAYFQVPSRDEIAKRVHRGGGTVSRVIDEFKKEAKSKGWKSAAEEYGVSQIIEELHELSVIVNKNNMAPIEAIDGAKIAANLKSMNIDLNNINQFIKQVYSKSKEKDYSASDIVDDCEKIRNLEDDYELSFEEISEKFESMGSKLNILRKEINEQNIKNNEIKKLNVNLYDKYVTDKESLEKYKNTNDALTKLGLSLKDMEKIETVLIALKKEKLNPTKIIKKINEIKDLEEGKTLFEFLVKKLKIEYEDLKNKNEDIKKEITGKQIILDEAKKLEEAGLTINDIQAIRNTVIRISSNHGVTPKDALKRLQTDITKNYDKILGLEPTLTTLSKQKMKLETRIIDLKDELQETKTETEAKVNKLQEKYQIIKNQINQYISLREKGVTDIELNRWASIISSTKLDPKIIEEELKTQRNLRNLENEFNKKIRNQEQREKELQASITTLTSNKSQIEKSIETIQQTGINQIKSATKSSSTETQHILNLLNRTITEIKKDTLNTLKQSQQTNQNILDETEQSVENTKNDLTQISKEINSMVEKALTAGEEIGNLQPLANAYKFLGTGKGEPNIVHPISILFLKNLRTWLEEKNKLEYNIKNNIDSLINELKIK